MWFQPSPDVDLGNIKPSNTDIYPKELEKNLQGSGEGMASSPIYSNFFQKYKKIISQNNFPEEDKREKNLLEITVLDYTKRSHLLTQYLSKVASPDSNNFTAVDKDDGFITQFESNDFHDTKGQLKRGIRTLKEVAHFVRCIPLNDLSIPHASRVWSTPDVMLTMRCG